MTEQPKVASVPETLESLKARLGIALADGNDPEVIAISKLILKQKSDVEKVETARLLAEAEALAGDREKLAKSIWKAVGGVVSVDALNAVKATGFTYKLDAPDAQGAMVFYKSVALTVPTIKTRGGGGGSTGALKQQTGLSRHELIDTYATQTEKDAVDLAFNSASSRPDSARYSAEKPVIKRILADNPNLIKR